MSQSVITNQKKGLWSINDVYNGINFGCWNYESVSSGLYGLYVWGHNPHGEFGAKRTSPSRSHVPILVGAVDCWDINMNPDDMIGYYAIMAKKTDGSVFSWGHNNHGQLGNGSFTPASSPSQIAGIWRCVSQGTYFGAGVKCDGTLWTWGHNPHGQLGLNFDGGDRPTPQQVGTNTNWCSVNADHHQAFAIKTDNTLWAWGHNPHGHLGVGDNTPRSSPTQIPGSWTCTRGGARGTFGRKTDGSHHAWGPNPHGVLGVGNQTSYCSPVGIGGCWCNISKPVNSHWTTVGRNCDGGLYVWGHNIHGERGDCCADRNNTLSPCLIPHGTNWCWGAAGHNQAWGVKCDGTLWGWGQNPHSEIDIGSSPRSSPQQIVGTNWRDIAAGHWMIVARTDGVSQCQLGICPENYPNVRYPSFGVCCYN